MAIVNRDLDPSEQARVISASVATVTGQTYNLAVIPYQAQLISAMNASNGLSGAPNHSLFVQRFVAGAGVTSVVLGASMVVTTFGTSGAQTYTIVNSGLSFLLQAGDVLLLNCQAANTATISTTVSFAVKALQDIKTSYGA